MKKKLVAFAVTAAMVITSAVPVFADTMGGWTDSVVTKPNSPVVEGNPNVIRINEKGFTTTEEVAGTLSETPITFETIIDLNDGPSVFASDTFKLQFSDKDGKAVTQTVVLSLTQSDYEHTFFTLKNGAETSTYGTGLRGIATAVWAVTEDEVTVELYENGNKYNPVATLVNDIPDGAVATSGLTAVAAVGKTFDMYVQYPTYVEEVSVQIDNPAYDQKKADKLKDDYNVPKYIDADQPVLGTPLYVNEITLTADTVIAREEIKKYADVKWYRDNVEITSSNTTGLDKDFPLTYTPTTEDKGHKITVEVTGLKEKSGIFGGKTWGNGADAIARFDRLAGADRYETAMAVADYMIKNVAKCKNGFESIIVASGNTYADALSGVALAKKLDAPILLVNKGSEDAIVEYINDNAVGFNADIYILGGESAVSASFAEKLNKYDVTRLSGADRYETNVEVLKALGLKATDKDVMLVASGNDYADALSASATGYPVVLVGDSWTKAQKDYLKTLGNNDYYHVIGGTSAVNNKVMNVLKSKDYVLNPDTHVVRVAGATRFETSAKVYEKYKDTAFKGTTYAFIASGNDYPDGLVVGALAHFYSAPILLVNGDNTGYANKIVASIGSSIKTYNIMVAGGENAVSNEAVQKIAAKVDAAK